MKLRLLALLSALLLLTGCTPKQEENLTVTLLKVGKADAIVALSGTQALVIDTGEDEDGEEVVEFLRQHGITRVQALILTHFDRDHVGGADTLLEELPVDVVYLPDYAGTHEEYFRFLEAAEQTHTMLQPITEPFLFDFGQAQVQIDPPDSYEIENPDKDSDNNFSLITTVTHGENRLVFTGDAEKKRLRQYLAGDGAQKCDFLKVPHHGVYNGALEDLLETLRPDYAVICSSRKNPAEDKTLALLGEYCPHIFETKDGDVTVTSNGKTLAVTQDTD